MILKKISPWFLFQVLSLPFLAQSFNEAPNLKLQSFCFNDSIYLLCTVRPSDLVYKRLSEREGFICGMRIRYGYTSKTSDFNFSNRLPNSRQISTLLISAMRSISRNASVLYQQTLRNCSVPKHSGLAVFLTK